MSITNLTGTSWVFDKQMSFGITAQTQVVEILGTMTTERGGLIATSTLETNFRYFRRTRGPAVDSGWVAFMNTSNGADFTNNDFVLYWRSDTAYGIPYTSSGSQYDVYGLVTLHITGGAGVTDADFITWLEANASRVPDRLSVDLNSLSNWASAADGQHVITIKAKATGYRTSRASEAVTVNKGAVGHTIDLSTGSYDVSPYQVYDGSSATGTALTSMSSSSSAQVTITSGYMTILGATVRGAESNTGTCSGGVAFDQWLSEDTARYIVTGNGAVSGFQWGCFVEGTPILLANGTTKPVEEITYDDELLVWNFYEGKLDHAKPCWIMEEKVATQYKKVTLSNGIVLKLVGAGDNCHRLYNVTKQKMLYANECVGDEVYTLDGIATVVSCEKVDETVKYYNLTTEKYLDCFAEGVLTGSRLNNMYNIENMKYTDDKRLISEEEEAERWAVRRKLGEVR